MSLSTYGKARTVEAPAERIGLPTEFAPAPQRSYLREELTVTFDPGAGARLGREPELVRLCTAALLVLSARRSSLARPRLALAVPGASGPQDRSVDLAGLPDLAAVLALPSLTRGPVHPGPVPETLSLALTVDPSGTYPVHRVPFPDQDTLFRARMRDGQLELTLDWESGLYSDAGAAALLEQWRDLIADCAERPHTPVGVGTADTVAPRTPETADGPSALPAPEPPRCRVERTVAEIWSAVLGSEVLGRDNNFFVEGGGSLHALKAARRMQERFRVEIPPTALFEVPTVREAAQRVTDLWLDAPEPDPGATAPVPGTAPRPHDQDAPPPRHGARASSAEERIWFFEHWRPGGASHHMPWAVDIEGELDTAALDRAVERLVARHESLRTVFRSDDGRPVPEVLERLDVTVRQHLVTAGTDGERRADAEELVRGLCVEPFVLEGGPLVRLDTVTLTPREHVLVLTVHHMISDGASVTAVIDDLSALYRAEVTGGPADLPPVPGFRAVDALRERRLDSQHQQQTQQQIGPEPQKSVFTSSQPYAVCFPECFVPGYRGMGKQVAPPDAAFLEEAFGEAAPPAKAEEKSVVWKLDNLESIGGHNATKVGSPRLLVSGGSAW